MRLRYEAEARREVLVAVDWFEAQAPGYGALFYSEVRSAERRILEAPFRWPVVTGIVREPPVRRVLVRRFRYVLPYVVSGDEVIVLAVSHQRRDGRYWLRRLP